MSIKVQEGREMQENYLEDETVLTSYMHDMRAAREDADRELAHMRKMAEDAHKDWMRKLKDRRKEVCVTRLTYLSSDDQCVCKPNQVLGHRAYLQHSGICLM